MMVWFFRNENEKKGGKGAERGVACRRCMIIPFF